MSDYCLKGLAAHGDGSLTLMESHVSSVVAALTFLCTVENMQFNFTSLSSLFFCFLFLRMALGNWHFILLCVSGHVGSQYLPEMGVTILNLEKCV